MPSYEDIAAAELSINRDARKQLMLEGHDNPRSLELIMRYMPYSDKVTLAERYRGEKIYREPYSNYP